ncbi:uncharacterized protein LOC129233547 [Uloborus diversus]|uniref:uncharacterized protein LOC129228263 n=1 Tax=Uloborus diversus TaxID=327109 RepID=UPI0024096EDD|nr:uncharacterized protein LOC129228263 [Uloborus diversus]XP_054723534.1 uncharacterized protein LOC129233547 [Uloborus diversus]
MDKCSSDAEFDSYWDYEAKNKNRNRIRVGRQYQASIPPLLKPGEKDGRKCEDLETIKWKPDQLTDQEIEQYLSMAKGIGLFAKAVDNPKNAEKSDSSLQSAIKGLSEFVASHHPCHHDDGCQVPKPSSSGESECKINVANDWSPSEAQLFAQALEACGKNFCAIKKEFLPWKPVRSIIEYYYQGKGEKPEDLPEEKPEIPTDLLTVVKKEDEPVPSCSYNLSPVEPFVEKEEKKETSCEAITSENTETAPTKQHTETAPINFLANTRVTDHCGAVPETRIVGSQSENIASSTVGSLNFFLGGRLVLKLDAQQDSGSGSKCQWVQSNDLPKHSNSSKKVKHKKKSINDGSFVIASPQKKKKADESVAVANKLLDHDSLVLKKPKLHSEYDFTENDQQGLLLCSYSWTPPVADGQETVEMDDCSSKTSEGYVSPVLSNSRSSKLDSRGDIAGNHNSVSELGEQNCDSDHCMVKYEPRANSAQSESSYMDDSASKNICCIGGKNSPNQLYNDKQEVLNHKSALTHSKSRVKSPCYQSRVSHSSSPLLKQWNKWSNTSYPVKNSPNSLSPVSHTDSKSPLKDIPLDLSSKESNSTDSDLCESQAKTECYDKSMVSEMGCLACKQCAPESSNHQSLPGGAEPAEETQCSDGINSEQQLCVESLKESSDCSPCKSSGDQTSYAYINLPYPCALPKCTKEYSLEEHLCNKTNSEKNEENGPDYIIHDVDESICKKPSAWCNNTMASYLQYYPQCYPYYLTYGIAQNAIPSEPTVTEVPLDLSSTESIKETTAPETLSEEVNSVPSKNTEAIERGMLYQLLKNKTSK